MVSRRGAAVSVAVAIAAAAAIPAQGQNAVEKKSTVTIKEFGPPILGSVGGSPACIRKRKVIVLETSPERGKLGQTRTNAKGKWALFEQLAGVEQIQAKVPESFPGGPTVCLKAISGFLPRPG